MSLTSARSHQSLATPARARVQVTTKAVEAVEELAEAEGFARYLDVDFQLESCYCLLQGLSSNTATVAPQKLSHLYQACLIR